MDWLNVQLHSNRVLNCTEAFQQLPSKTISRKKEPRGNKKLTIVGNVPAVCSTLWNWKWRPKLTLAPLHWSARTLQCDTATWTISRVPEYASRMNNSAREPQIDLTVAATDVALWSLLDNKRRRTPPGCCIRRPTLLQISGRCRVEVILPHAATALRSFATWN